jgi:hypothetical protein
MTFYEFITLKHPFADAQTSAEVMQAIVDRDVSHASFSKSRFQPSPPMDIGWLLRAGLQRDVTKRYQTADELLRRLDDRAMGKVPVQCHITATKRSTYELQRLAGRYPIPFTVGLVACLGAVVYAIAR